MEYSGTMAWLLRILPLAADSIKGINHFPLPKWWVEMDDV